MKLDSTLVCTFTYVHIYVVRIHDYFSWLPVTNTKYICDNRVASTALYKCFKTGGRNTKWPMLIWVKLLQIAYNAPMLWENLDIKKKSKQTRKNYKFNKCDNFSIIKWVTYQICTSLCTLLWRVVLSKINGISVLLRRSFSLAPQNEKVLVTVNH